MYGSLNNTMHGNNIIANGGVGIYLYSTSNNTINENTVMHNSNGITVRFNSDNNQIFKNNITANNNNGITISEAKNNRIARNNIIANGGAGIQISSWIVHSSGNNIVENNIVANKGFGICLFDSTENIIFHNNFISNVNQAFSDRPNVWDDGYPSGGNYWSDYTGVDLYGGPYQNETGSDGIGDTPYVIDAYNVDHYPLMIPYPVPPPPIYTLTIVATIGGTTSPAPGTYTYTAGSMVQVTAIPYTSYKFDYWELDGANVGSANPYTVLMDKNHTLKAVFSAIPPLTVSINPLSASILVGQSVTFTSTVSGGVPPYTYQWFLNGNPVSGATSNNWTFTPTSTGIFYVYLTVKDAKGNIAQSDAARIAVATVPVGGYSIPIQTPTKKEPILPYIALITTLTITMTKIRNKTKRRR
jgi:parallel beta-helix repeat protein